VVLALGESAGREIVRIAAVVDASPDRARTLLGGLNASGVLVNQRGSGAAGLAMLHNIPGVDVILIGDALPDMTIDQVLADIASNDAVSEAPVFLVTSNEELGTLYADRIAGTLPDPADLSALDEVFAETLTGDRAQADELAQRAAAVLAHLARSGNTDVSSALGSLASALTGRSDAVTVPAMVALQAAGTPGEAAALLAVLTDTNRSEEVRAGAAGAVGGIFSRHGVTSAEMAGALEEVLVSDSPVSVRRAAASALGRATLEGADRARFLHQVRFGPAQQ
jgi:CheY-like chemotaxis protein